MAFDGLVVRALAQELNQKLSGARLDKIYQPERDTLVLQLRGSQGAKRLLLTAKGDKGQVEAILSQTPGVQSAELTQDGELTHGTLQLEGEDPREALFFAFAQAGLPLLDFHLDETSLEQIFLGLTQEQPQAPAKPSRLRWRRKATEPVAVVSVDEGKEVPDESDL